MYNMFEFNQIAVKQVLTMVQANVNKCSLQQVNLNLFKIMRKKLKHHKKSETISLKSLEVFHINNNSSFLRAATA